MVKNLSAINNGCSAAKRPNVILVEGERSTTIPM